MGWELPCFETWEKLTDLGACLLEIYRNVSKLFSQSNWRGNVRKVTDVPEFQRGEKVGHLALWQKGKNQAALERDLRDNRCYVFLKSLSLTSSSFELKVPNVKAVSQETKSCHLYLSSTCESKHRCCACAVASSLYNSLGWECQIPEVWWHARPLSLNFQIMTQWTGHITWNLVNLQSTVQWCLPLFRVCKREPIPTSCSQAAHKW